MGRKYKGFTIIELLVVVAIIGILATIVIISVTGARTKSNYAKVLSDMTAIAKAVDLYQSQNNNVYPGDGIVETLPPVLSGYLPTWPATPCGSDYAYEYQNWNIDRSSGGAGYSGAGGYIGVHFVNKTKSDPARWIYFYDIHNFASLANIGVDIKTVNTITCTE